MIEILLGFLKIGATGYGGPAIIGVMAVLLVRIAPHAAPDAPAIVAPIVTTAVLLVWRVAPLKATGGGAIFGILRDRVWAR